jgi:transposase
MSVTVAPHPPRKALAWHIQAQVRPDQEAMRHDQHVQACCGLGTHIGTSEVSEAAVLAADKGPSAVEGGLRWLKAPLVLVASWWVNKPSRSEGLVRVMTLAWLVYSGAQRRLRQP